MESGTIAIIAVLIAQSGLIFSLFAWLRSDMRRMEERINTRIDERIALSEANTAKLIAESEARMNERFARQDERMARQDERMAHLTGLLDGLREAIAARVPA